MSDELDRLVARSRALGADPALVVHGGGNTSTKLEEADHLGRRRAVMRIKGSGTDLATIGRDGFPGVVLSEVLPLQSLAVMSDEDMVAHLGHAATEPGGRAPSIETLLHAFLAAPHVDHTHADAICALTNHPSGRDAVAEALGTDVAYVPYVRPGFDLSKAVAEQGGARAVVLEHHGLVVWGRTHEATLARTHEIVREAEAYLGRRTAAQAPFEADLPVVARDDLLAALREALAPAGRVVLGVDERQRAMADHPEVQRIAAVRGTPDHMLRIGPRTLVVRDSGEVEGAIAAYRATYEAYVERHRALLPPGTPTLPSLPRVVLIPGLGGVAAAPDARRAEINADLALRSHSVSMRALDAFGDLEWLDEEEVFAFEHWPMELRKLAGAPPSPPLAGAVVALRDDVPEAVATALRDAGAEVVADILEGRDRFGGLDAEITVTGNALQAVTGDGEACVRWSAGAMPAVALRVLIDLLGADAQPVQAEVRLA